MEFDCYKKMRVAGGFRKIPYAREFRVLIVVVLAPTGLQLAVQPRLSYWLSAPMLIEAGCMLDIQSTDLPLASYPTYQRRGRTVPVGTEELLQHAHVPMASPLHPLMKGKDKPIINQDWK